MKGRNARKEEITRKKQEWVRVREVKKETRIEMEREKEDVRDRERRDEKKDSKMKEV